MTPEIIFGPPGTGKTTELLRLMEEELERGTAPERIAFVSFTKNAVNVAVQRASAKFGISQRELRWFRTLHSLAYSALGMSRERIMPNYSKFGKECGFKFSAFASGLDAVFGARKSADSIVLRFYELRRATLLSEQEVFRRWQLPVNVHRLDSFMRRLKEWKTEHDVHDFHDLIKMFIDADQPLDVDVAFIDEAQDLTPRQWTMVGVAFRNARRVVVAGDDDQAIYGWAGADVTHLISMPGTKRVLSQSFRLPQRIQHLAVGVSKRIREREPKQWHGTEDVGVIKGCGNIGSLPLQEGSWLLLAANNYSLKPMTERLRLRGIMHRVNGELCVYEPLVNLYRTLVAFRTNAPVTKAARARFFAAAQARYEEPDYLVFPKADLADLRFLARCAHLGTLNAPVHIDVSTIHHAKGAEADNVLLCNELSRASQLALHNTRYSDHIHRTMYVGVSRAKKRLYIFENQPYSGYKLGSLLVSN